MGRHLWLRINRQSGFTLIELLGVMVIVLLLSLVAVTVFIDVTGKVRRSASEGKLTEVEQALEVYQINKGHYPVKLADLITENYIQTSDDGSEELKYKVFASPYYDEGGSKYFYYAVTYDDRQMPVRFVLVDPYALDCPPGDNDNRAECHANPGYKAPDAYVGEMDKGWRTSGEAAGS